MCSPGLYMIIELENGTFYYEKLVQEGLQVRIPDFPSWFWPSTAFYLTYYTLGHLFIDKSILWGHKNQFWSQPPSEFPRGCFPLCWLPFLRLPEMFLLISWWFLEAETNFDVRNFTDPNKRVQSNQKPPTVSVNEPKNIHNWETEKGIFQATQGKVLHRLIFLI